jgi:hypothetical protein
LGQLTAVVDALPDLFYEMQQQQSLRKNPIIRFLMDNDLYIQYVEFLLAVAINLILLATFHYDGILDRYQYNGTWVHPTLVIIGIITIFLTASNLFLVMIQ